MYLAKYSIFESKWELMPGHYTIGKVNKSSAYAQEGGVPFDDKKTSFRINQKTHEVANGLLFGESYALWLDPNDFYAAQERQQQLTTLREQALQKVKTLTLEQLRAFLDQSATEG